MGDAVSAIGDAEMKPPEKNDPGPVKAMAWITDAEFGYDHWRAAEFSCGRGTKFAIISLFDTEKERDDVFSLLVDAEVKRRMAGD